MPFVHPNLPRAATLITLGRLDEAERMVRDGLAADPRSDLGFRLLADCLRLQGRAEEAVEMARRALALSADEPRSHVCLARALEACHRQDEAIAHAREAVRLDPQNLDALYTLGWVAMEVDLDEAERAAGMVQAGAPFASAGHHLRARIEIARRRWPEAERWSRLALRCDPSSAAEMNNLAVILRRQGRTQEAEELQREAVRLAPGREGARRNLHEAMRVREERGSGGEGPYSAADVASTLRPVDQASSLVGVINAAMRDGRIEQARAAADEAWTLVQSLPLDTPRDRLVRVLVVSAIGRVEMLAHRPEAVLDALLPVEQDALALLAPSGRRSFLSNLALARMRTGDTAGAIRTFTELLELERGAGNADLVGRSLLNLGAAWAEHGDDAMAERSYRECVAIADANGHTQRAATARSNLARVALRAGRVEEASQLIEQAREMLAPLNLPVVLADFDVVRGAVVLRRGDLPLARRTLLTALRSLHRSGDRRAADGYSYLAEVAAADGRFTIAGLHLHRAERRATTAGTRRTAEQARRTVESRAAQA